MKLADELILFLLLKKKRQKFIHSRNRKVFFKQLSTEARKRRRRCIPRDALHMPEDSGWRKLYNSRNDQALITLTGLDHFAFDYLESKFRTYYDGYSPYGMDGCAKQKHQSNKGRKRLMNSKDCLGLILAWTRTRGSMMCLQIIFGLTQSILSLYLQFGMNLLILVLQDLEEAKVKVPSTNKISELQSLVRNRHPVLTDVWCTMDGLKLYLQCPGTDDEQNNYYNGWQCDHFINSVLVFCPDGTIPICCYNVPGTQHDSTIAHIGGIYDKLHSVYEETGAKCTVDSAFSKLNRPYLIKSGKKNLNLSREDQRILAAATSMRQSAEWGMKAFQSSFPRIKDRIPWEYKGKRKLVLKMLILLYNFRTRLVGINQIRNVYKTNLEIDANMMFVHGR